MGPTSKGRGREGEERGGRRGREGREGEGGVREAQPHFLATPLRGGIEGQGRERGGMELGGYCLQLLGGIIGPGSRVKKLSYCRKNSATLCHL